jgi:hypothetical protein
MRVAIRLLAGATLIIFVMAIGAAQHGEQARATLPLSRWPGFVETLALFALLALTLLLFAISSILGLILAIRKLERPWVIAIALSVMGIVLGYLGLLLPAVRFVLPQVSLWGVPAGVRPSAPGKPLLNGV